MSGHSSASASRSRLRRLETTPERSRLLRRVRQKNTAPEAAVQEMLSRLQLAYSTHVRGIPGSPDIVAVDRSRAVFVHGCFWHRHPGCRACSTPKRNAAFWLEKFATNVRRDQRNARQLRKLGYRVMTAWECQTKTETKRLRLERRLQRFFQEPR